MRREGRLLATPLFVVLLVVETTDILFATDSIPAILAITRDPFIVYTSNVFAILGLRSLYFALAGMMKLFHYLNYGLSVVLMFIGAKMLLPERYPCSHMGRVGGGGRCARPFGAGFSAVSETEAPNSPAEPNSEERQA